MPTYQYASEQSQRGSVKSEVIAVRVEALRVPRKPVQTVSGQTGEAQEKGDEKKSGPDIVVLGAIELESLLECLLVVTH